MITGKCEQYVPAAVSISTPALGAGKSLQARKNCHPAELCGVGQYADQVDFKKKKSRDMKKFVFFETVDRLFEPLTLFHCSLRHFT